MKVAIIAALPTTCIIFSIENVYIQIHHRNKKIPYKTIPGLQRGGKRWSAPLPTPGSYAMLA
jgi:hypothetical protein